jgi:hypothetical protein
MISASSKRSHVALSSSPSKSVAWISALRASRVLERFSRRRRKKPRRCSGASAAGAATVAPSPVMKTSVQSRGIGGARR